MTKEQALDLISKNFDVKFYDRLRNKGFSGVLSWQLADLYVEIDSLKKEIKNLKEDKK